MSLHRWMIAGSVVAALTLAQGCAVDSAVESNVENVTAREAGYGELADQNLENVAVRRLATALNEDWAEEEKSCGEWSGIKSDRLHEIFSSSEDLMREFGDFVEPHNEEALQMIYLGLREMLYNHAAVRMFAEDLEQGRFRRAYAQYPDLRKDLLRDMGKALDGDYLPRDGELPTIIVNVASERTQVFYDGMKVHDEQVVVGQREYDNYNENSKTRLGDHVIASWHHCYGNADYPSWCDNKMKGAFGEWTAKLDRGYQYLHGSVGDGLLNWAAVKFAKGSHGCVRNRNEHISFIHDIAPEGTPVRKIYATTERYATTNKPDTSARECEADPFGDGINVRFRVRDADNHYRYDVGNYPASLPEEERLSSRPNGVYYPDLGVTVGYAHPDDAVLQPF